MDEPRRNEENDQPGDEAAVGHRNLPDLGRNDEAANNFPNLLDDSDDDSMNLSDPVASGSSYDAIVDSEHDRRSHNGNTDTDIVSDSGDEPAVDSGDDLDHENSDGDLDVADADVGNVRDIFAVNVEANALDEHLIAEGNMQRMERFVLQLAKSLRHRESYKSMLASFRIDNLAFDNSDFPTGMRSFWKLVNRTEDELANVIVCTGCWQELGRGKKPEIDCCCGSCGPDRKNLELETFLYINL